VLQRFVDPAGRPCHAKRASQGGAAPSGGGEGIPVVSSSRARTYRALVARDRAQGPARNQREEARVARQRRVAQVRFSGSRAWHGLTGLVGTWRAASQPRVLWPSSKRSPAPTWPGLPSQRTPPLSLSPPPNGPLCLCPMAMPRIYRRCHHGS